MPRKSAEREKKEKDVGTALQRFMYGLAIGCALIVIYALRIALGGSADFITVVSVGIMAGGASVMTGGLLGFLFGIPYTRDEVASEHKTESDPNRRDSRSANYRPNTSLEQIADWLTKILVGVGLVQIQVIPAKLVSLANYVARGLGGTPSSETFALAILVYFSICGFVFGFLWARLYFPGWFRDADQIQILKEELGEVKKQLATDAEALAVVEQQLNAKTTDDPQLDEAGLAEKMLAASPSARAQMFRHAEATSANSKAEDYKPKLQGAIRILRALIRIDTDDSFHRNHSALAHALRRKTPRESAASENEFTKAIEIRDKLRLKGWKSYEFYRAICRIEQDPNFKKNLPSESAVGKRILDDLKSAYSDNTKWQRWSESSNTDFQLIEKWMKDNNVTEDMLRRT